MVDVRIAYAFCKDGCGGNPAGVVLDRPDLTGAQKQGIAAALGFSETVFVRTGRDSRFLLEYFTPTGEVPLCGHATVAAFHVLDRLGLLTQGHNRISTKAGDLSVEAEEDGMILMEQNLPEYGKVLPPGLLEGCFDGLDLDPSLPIQAVSTGLKDILLPVASPRALDRLTPAFERIARLSREQDAVGIHAFALTDEDGLTAQCRNFAPLYGINEESATGTSNCALACYLFRHREMRDRYVFEQGRVMGAPSRITVKPDHHGGILHRVFVGGYARMTGRQTIQP